MKTLLLKLLMASLFLWTISCGQIELVSMDSMQASGPSALSRLEVVEASATELIEQHKLLNRELGRSYSRVVVAAAKASNPFTLAKLIFSEGSSLEELLGWADTLLDSIRRVNSPLVSDRVTAIRALRDAETDPVLRARYDAILTRVEEEHTVTRVSVVSLQRKVQQGIRNIVRAQDWMFRSYLSTLYFSTLGSGILDKVLDLDVTLNYLDVNLDRIDRR